ncbi:MAG: LamG-like jellyroll fold domain-containing protein, partial [Pirellulales bacterium]
DEGVKTLHPLRASELNPPITVALSYSMMRLQVTSSQIQINVNRQGNARQAALSGLSIGIRQIRESSWEGVDTTNSGQLDDHVYYKISFEVGDPTLSSDDADIDEYPYRVTVVSTGIVIDPLDASHQSTYTVRAVMQLIRKQMAPALTVWDEIQSYQAYLYGTGTNQIEMPFQIDGNAFFHGPLNLVEDLDQYEKPFHGLIDEVAVFDRVLSPAEISSVYSIGNTVDSNLSTEIQGLSPKAWWRFGENSTDSAVADEMGVSDGVYKGGTYPGLTLGDSNKACYFDGSSGRAELGTLDITNGNEMSILTWFAVMDGDDHNNEGRIISKASSTTDTDHKFMLSMAPRSGWKMLRGRVTTESTTATSNAVTGYIINDQWTLGVLTYDGSHIKLYKDGSHVGSENLTGNVETDPTMSLWVGDNSPGSPRSRYLEDLLAMQEDGLGDYRPITGDVTLNSDQNPLAEYLTLWKQLGLEVSYESTSIPTSSEGITGQSTYQLYPGGPNYKITELSNRIEHLEFSPDVYDNPLGILRCGQTITLGDNTTINGTLITNSGNSDIILDGTNIEITPETLPSLKDSSEVLDMPALFATEDVDVRSECNASINGAVYSGGSYKISTGSDSTECHIQGLLLAYGIQVETRTLWENTLADGRVYFEYFLDDQVNSGVSPYFPQWLSENYVAYLNKKLTIEPPVTEKKHHWLDLTQPIYQVHDDDEGLVWDFVQWIDDPEFE